jgi:hypothetical protein
MVRSLWCSTSTVFSFTFSACLLSWKHQNSIIEMSHLQYFDYPGFGERSKRDLNYSQAVRIDNRIEISGQGSYKAPKNVPY